MQLTWVKVNYKSHLESESSTQCSVLQHSRIDSPDSHSPHSLYLHCNRQQLSHLIVKALDYFIAFNSGTHQNDKRALCCKLSSAMQCLIHPGSCEALHFKNSDQILVRNTDCLQLHWSPAGPSRGPGKTEFGEWKVSVQFGTWTHLTSLCVCVWKAELNVWLVCCRGPRNWRELPRAIKKAVSQSVLLLHHFPLNSH